MNQEPTIDYTRLAYENPKDFVLHYKKLFILYGSEQGMEQEQTRKYVNGKIRSIQQQVPSAKELTLSGVKYHWPKKRT